ncbi:hypothetical protein TrLO_g377 [Triparma laevis f. longispina]|uniref:Fungal lipase-type domain-containing protein n=1 Tax=Triparma laevis f. longispina TaxID=1714387 RepID=A0A9W7F9Z4_9STRA|nr:hypothetical protein TrLO_g377 [Triparma laevis f. longispina]
MSFYEHIVAESRSHEVELQTVDETGVSALAPLTSAPPSQLPHVSFPKQEPASSTSVFTVLDDNTHDRQTQYNPSLNPMYYRWEFLSKRQMNFLFNATFTSELIAIGIFIGIAVTYDTKTKPTDDPFSTKTALVTMNLVFAAIAFILYIVALYVYNLRRRQTRNQQSKRQRVNTRTTIVALLVLLTWAALIIVINITIANDACPLFVSFPIFLTMVRITCVSTMLFILHVFALDHLIKRSGEFVSTAKFGFLYYIPSFVSCYMIAAVSIASDAIFLNEYLPYDPTACDALKQGTFVCAPPQKQNTHGFLFANVGHTLVIINSIALAILIVILTVSWRRLSKFPRAQFRDTHTSLRLYMWQTSWVYITFYVINLTQILAVFNDVNICSSKTFETTGSPELFQLAAVWLLTRAFLFTPIPDSLRASEASFKMRLAFLQQFIWFKDDSGLIEDSKAFWKDREAEERPDSTNASEILPYGGGTSLESQPVFNFEISLIASWACLVSYMDGADPDLLIGDVEAATPPHPPPPPSPTTPTTPPSPLKALRQAAAEAKAEAEKATFMVALMTLTEVLTLTNHTILYCDKLSLRAIVAWSANKVVVSFRGSAEAANFASDMKFVRKRHPTMPVPAASNKTCCTNAPFIHGGILDAFVNSDVSAAVCNIVQPLLEANKSLQILVTGHSLGGALAQLQAYDIATTLPITKEQIAVYTLGCPGIGNQLACNEITSKVPNTFNIVNGVDKVYHFQKYSLGVRHPGIPVSITAAGDILVRPSFVEEELAHVFWRESLTDHLGGSYLTSFGAIINKHQNLHGRLPSLLSSLPGVASYLSDDIAPPKASILFSPDLSLNLNYAGDNGFTRDAVLTVLNSAEVIKDGVLQGVKKMFARTNNTLELMENENEIV